MQQDGSDPPSREDSGTMNRAGSRGEDFHSPASSLARLCSCVSCMEACLRPDLYNNRTSEMINCILRVYTEVVVTVLPYATRWECAGETCTINILLK